MKVSNGVGGMDVQSYCSTAHGDYMKCRLKCNNACIMGGQLGAHRSVVNIHTTSRVFANHACHVNNDRRRCVS